MNLKEIRDAMFAQADYSPSSSPEATSRVNGFINRAYNTLALEAPFLFFESKAQLATEPDVSSKGGKEAVAGDRIQLQGTTAPGGAKDPWTWKVTYTGAEASTHDGNFTYWKTDRSWDGRMIEITTADGTRIHNQIRTVWKETEGLTFRYTFTLVHPWDTETYDDGTGTISGFAGFKYRIFTDAYALPDDVIELKSARLRDVDMNYPLSVFGQAEAEQRQLDGPPSQVASGMPRVIFRRGHQKLMGPAVAPEASKFTTKDGSGDFIRPWIGPEPPGQFEYKVTYTWGKRDSEFMLPGLGQWNDVASPFNNTDQTFLPKSPGTGTTLSNTPLNAVRNRYREPRFESAPSPVSGVVNHTHSSTASSASPYASIRLSLPNVEYAAGFLTKFFNGIGGTPTTYSRESLHQSGMHVRIYRKRTATYLESYSEVQLRAAGLHNSQLDSAEDFYLLAEFRVDETNQGVFYDDGQIVPDYSRRLREVHGYQTFQFYPKPDSRYVTEVRCVMKPQTLAADEDTPVLHREAMSVLLERSMALFYENLGQPQLSALAMQRYREGLLTLSKRYGDLRPSGTPVLRRMTRATTSYRSNHYYRKWWTTSS